MSWFVDKKTVVQQPSGFIEAEVWTSRDPVVDAQMAKTGGKAFGGEGAKKGGTVTLAKDAKKGRGPAGGLSGAKLKALSYKNDDSDEDGHSTGRVEAEIDHILEWSVGD